MTFPATALDDIETGICYSRAIIRSFEGISVPAIIRALRHCRFLKMLVVTQKEKHSVRIIGTTGAAAILEKRWRTERPSLPLYLNELPIENCHFRNPDSAFILKRVAQMAPWHHVGATMDITLDTTFIFVWQAAKPRTAKFNLYFTVVAIWYSLVSTACTYSFLESGWGYIWFLRKTFIVFTKYDHGIYFRSNCLGWFVRYRTSVPDETPKFYICTVCTDVSHTLWDI